MPSNKISPEEANARVLAGEPIQFLDTRNPNAWKSSDRKYPVRYAFQPTMSIRI